MADRSIVFIDGNNWYHGLKGRGISDYGRLDYRRICTKLLGPRTWVGLRYYVGRVNQEGNSALYAGQRSYVAQLKAQDARISVHFGRLEPRSVKSEAARELLDYLSRLPRGVIPTETFRDLVALASRHRETRTYVEKAVDVMLAVDLVALAIHDEYDCAYLLSADGDYTPAVEQVCSLGKKVYAVAATSGHQLKSVCTAFVSLQPDWFQDCYMPNTSSAKPSAKARR